MRNVLKSSEVFHYFANKVQPSGRCSNTSFALPNAYSYGATIGRHIAPGIVALSDQRWSVTTAKHQSDLLHACRHLEIIFVPDVTDVRTSFNAVKLSVEKLIKQASTARNRKDLLIAQALQEVDQFNKFSGLCNSDLRIDSPVTDTAALTKIAQAVKANNAVLLAAKKEREAIDKLDIVEALNFWREGKLTNNYQLRRSPVALRINGAQIETSYGASIPLSEASALWTMVKKTMRGDRDYETGQPIGVYRLTKIRKDGSLVVGCHDIAFSELQAIAEILGYITLQAA